MRHKNEDNGENEENWREKYGSIDNEEKKTLKYVMVCIKNSIEFTVLELLF